MKRHLQADVYVGAAITLFAVFLLFQTPYMPKEAATFPILVLSTLGIFGLAVAVSGLRQKAAEQNGNAVPFLQKVKYPVLTLLLVSAYAALMEALGFFAATAVYIVCFMIYFKETNWRKIAVTVVAICVFIYALFVMQLNVMLPQGLLF